MAKVRKQQKRMVKLTVTNQKKHDNGKKLVTIRVNATKNGQYTDLHESDVWETAQMVRQKFEKEGRTITSFNAVVRSKMAGRNVSITYDRLDPELDDNYFRKVRVNQEYGLVYTAFFNVWIL